MKNFIKKWGFSIFCYIIALAITAYIIVGSFLRLWDDDYAVVLLEINALSPILLLIIIAEGNKPKKGN